MSQFTPCDDQKSSLKNRSAHQWSTILFLTAAVLVGCGRTRTESMRWPTPPQVDRTGAPASAESRSSVSSALSSSEIAQLDQALNQSKAVKVLGERVSTTPQRVGAAIIDGTWIRQVRDHAGKLVFVDANRLPEVPAELKARVERSQQSSSVVLGKLLHSVPELNNAAQIFELQQVLVPPSGLKGWRTRWNLDYLDRSEENFYRITASEQGRVIRHERLGTSLFVDGQAVVYPKGPRMSFLSDVVLHSLEGDGSLSSRSHKVSSALDSQAWSPENVFKFDVEDHRFDNVQTFYYVDQAVQWAKSNLGIELPFKLDVKVHIGGIEKPTNKAMYYQGNIRLGVGDGVLYRGLPRDPTVVIHETGHAFVDAIAGLDTTGENGSINEGIADFFAACVLDTPLMGEASYLAGPFRRSLLVQTKLSEANGGLYHDSAILSGALWKVRQAFGPVAALKFAFRALSRLNPKSTLADFKTAALYALEDGWKNEDAQKVLAILAEQGW